MKYFALLCLGLFLNACQGDVLNQHAHYDIRQMKYGLSRDVILKKIAEYFYKGTTQARISVVGENLVLIEQDLDSRLSNQYAEVDDSTEAGRLVSAEEKMILQFKPENNFITIHIDTFIAGTIVRTKHYFKGYDQWTENMILKSSGRNEKMLLDYINGAN